MGAESVGLTFSKAAREERNVAGGLGAGDLIGRALFPPEHAVGRCISDKLLAGGIPAQLPPEAQGNVGQMSRDLRAVLLRHC